MVDQVVEPGRVMGPAGFASRAAAVVLDVFIISIAQATAQIAISTLVRAFLPGVFHGVDLARAVPVVVGALIIIIYFIFSWTAFGRTIGMALMGVKLVTKDGKDVALWRAILRYIGFLLSALCLGLGFLWVLIDNRRMGWMDHLAGTQVLRVRRGIGSPVHRTESAAPSAPAVR